MRPDRAEIATWAGAMSASSRHPRLTVPRKRPMGGPPPVWLLPQTGRPLWTVGYRRGSVAWAAKPATTAHSGGGSRPAARSQAGRRSGGGPRSGHGRSAGLGRGGDSARIPVVLPGHVQHVNALGAPEPISPEAVIHAAHGQVREGSEERIPDPVVGPPESVLLGRPGGGDVRHRQVLGSAPRPAVRGVAPRLFVELLGHRDSVQAKQVGPLDDLCLAVVHDPGLAVVDADLGRLAVEPVDTLQ